MTAAGREPGASSGGAGLGGTPVEEVRTIVQWTAAAFFLLAMAYGGLSDLRGFRIPNWISLVAFLSFFPAAIGAGWQGPLVLLHLGAGVGVVAVGALLFAFGVVGGGDVKLMAAAAVWAGWRALPAFLVLMALGGGALALALVLFRRWKLPAALASRAWVRRLHSEEKGVPYGVAIAGAAIILLPDLAVVAAALPQ